MSEKGFAIFAKTGCSCQSCEEEKFIELFFKEDPTDAMQSCEDYVKQRTLRSQYSNTGIYEIKEFEYEPLGDGRKIIGKFITDDNGQRYDSRFNGVFERGFLENQITSTETLATYGQYLPKNQW